MSQEIFFIRREFSVFLSLTLRSETKANIFFLILIFFIMRIENTLNFIMNKIKNDIPDFEYIFRSSLSFKNLFSC